MPFEKTPLNGLYVFTPKVHKDQRGYFFESYTQKNFQEINLPNISFVQDNQSGSKRGTLRGLHYQLFPHSQAKLVRVLKGMVLDVVVDLRKTSSTFGKSFSIELSEENQKQLYIPKGFAHGFVVLSDWAEFFYKCDEYYHPPSERGILFNDPALGIDWKIAPSEIILSDKDKRNVCLSDAEVSAKWE